MSPDDPEGQTSIHALSPVSPKPVHYPTPSNIPILENQMDPAFSLDETRAEPKEQDMHNASQGMGSSQTAGQQEDTRMGNTEQSDGARIEGLNLDGQPMSLGSPDQASLTVSVPNPLPGPVNSSYQSPSETLSATTQPDGSAYQNGDKYLDSSAGAGSAVNLQALLDNLSAASAVSKTGAYALPNPDLAQSQTTLAATNGGADSNASSAQAASLPARPPLESSARDIRAFHPYETGVAPPVYVAPGTTYNAPGNPPPPGAGLMVGSLPPPPVASFQQQTNGQQEHEQQSRALEMSDADDRIKHEDADIPWGHDIQRQYDAFLKDERMYVTEGQWDKFPTNSRLFIGNLPTEKVTKRDLFHVFHKHGKLAQVSIKQAYGFIQYLDAQACYRALQADQGATIRGRKIHLEISKPQKNTRAGGGNSNNKNEGRESRNRRSRTPEHSRTNSGSGNANQKGADRYRGPGNNRQRQRDDYRPQRSPSPRGRDRRSPDRHGGRRRSRSRSPHGRGGTRRRSPSPVSGLEDDCPLPRRDPRNVPDLQIIAKDEPDRTFITFVEKTFESRGILTNVVVLDPRLSEMSVVRRQIIEGVLAVVKLDRSVQITQKFPLSVFDRSAGANNVRFEEYANLDLNICVELVLRAKQSSAQRPSSSPAFAASPYGLPMLQMPGSQQPQQQTPFAGFPQTQLQLPQQPGQQSIPSSSGLPSVNTMSLQQILSRVHQPTPSSAGPFSPDSSFPTQQLPQGLPATNDLSKLLAGTVSNNSNAPQGSAQGGQYANLANNPAFASLFAAAAGANQRQNGAIPTGSTPSVQQVRGAQGSPVGGLPGPGANSGGQPDMTNIMAQLARYGR